MIDLIRIHSSESTGVFETSIPAFDSIPLKSEQIISKASLPGPTLTESVRIPPSGLLILEGGGTLSNESWTIDNKAGWIYDVTGVRQVEHNFKCFNKPPIKDVVSMKGICLDLGSNWCMGNYAHWLLDCVGRLAVFEAAGQSIEDVDYIKLPLGLARQCPTVISKLQIPKNKLLPDISTATLVRFETLIRPTLAGNAHYYHPCLTDYLSKSVLVHAKEDEMIYLRRRGKRSVLNEFQLERRLVDRGFKIVDPSTDEFGEWAGARIVVAAHGAGLSDLAFCKPETRILELMSPNWQRMSYATLSQGRGIHYTCLLGSSGRAGEDINGHYSVCMDSVLSWVDQYR